MATEPEIVYDHFDDVTQVGPMIDNVQDLHNVILSPEFQNDMIHFLTDAENTAPPDIHDPFGLTQEIAGDVNVIPMSNDDDNTETIVVQNGRMPAPEALFRVSFFIGQLANWIFNSSSELSPEAIKRVIQGMLQNTPLPPEMLRTNPEVDEFSEMQRIKACLNFAQHVDASKIFLPCEIAPSVATDSFAVYRQIMEKYADGAPEILGDSKSIMISEFVHQMTGMAMLDAIHVSVKTAGLVIPPAGAGISSQELIDAAESMAQGGLRSSMQKEGKKGLSAETVRLVMNSLYKNLSAFNSYVEFLDDNNAATANQSEADAKEQARTLLCSYVWALWHVSGTSVLEAEEHLESNNIELTAQRKEDLMIIKLLELTFDDFKQPWSAIAKKIKANRHWIKPYENPEELRNKLVKKFQGLRKAKKLIRDNLQLKGLVDQQQDLTKELNRLKQIDRHWQAMERQGGLEARVRMILNESSHLRSRDIEFFDLLAEMAELHPQCKIRIHSDVTDEDLKKMLDILRDEPFDPILKTRLSSVEHQLEVIVDEISSKMPEGVVSYQQLESELKNVEREIYLAEFVYSVKLGKTFDPDEAGLNLKTNKDVFINRMKELHGERSAIQRQREKELATGQATLETVAKKQEDEGDED